MAMHEPTWHSPKSGPQWRASLQAYVYPIIGGTASVRDHAAPRHGGPAADLEREARDGGALGGGAQGDLDEIDMDDAIWTLTAVSMKANGAHRVPLSGRALEVWAKLGGCPRTGAPAHPS